MSKSSQESFIHRFFLQGIAGKINDGVGSKFELFIDETTSRNFSFTPLDLFILNVHTKKDKLDSTFLELDYKREDYLGEVQSLVIFRYSLNDFVINSEGLAYIKLPNIPIFRGELLLITIYHKEPIKAIGVARMNEARNCLELYYNGETGAVVTNCLR